MEMLKDLNIKNPGWVLEAILEGLNALINADKDFTVFTNLTVHQLLWGYHNPLLHMLERFEEVFSFLKEKLPQINEVVALQVTLINCTFSNHYQAENFIRINRKVRSCQGS